MATKKSTASSATRKRAPSKRVQTRRVASRTGAANKGSMRSRQAAHTELPDEGQLEKQSMRASDEAMNEEEE
jgi:hypothetical protein